uniref:NADH-ubiquinone oxidoreductase chain 2 n=1 Tax=Coleoptera sp. 3 KM-2017 TaxID=2219334 RepID=A0A346RHZ4_9COLE|nr:NADH dehydrogenase subunit 2 [Coleoptera sp. 3 KM-2017]
MNKSKSMFLITLIIGTLITISSNNWISMWMGLELNMLSFIPLILNKKNKMNSEAALIYFLTQSVSSMILMFSIIEMYGGKEMQLFIDLGSTSLLIKMGAAPFHMWFPEMMSKMKWDSCMLLMTWQKVAPLIMINNLIYSPMIMFFTVTASVIMGGLGGLNQTSLRKIMSYSSINHLGWILALNLTQNNWINYLIMYSVMTITICSMFHMYNMYFINQINGMNISYMEKISYSVSMLSLGGLPPFIGFLPKWMVLQSLISDNKYILMSIMIMMSLITLFYYMRTMTSMMLSYSSTSMWHSMNSNSYINYSILMLNLSLPLVLIFNFN